MSTNLTLDDALVKEAMTLGHHRTRRGAVHAALREYLQRRKQRELPAIAGTVELAPGWDHRSGRGKR